MKVKPTAVRRIGGIGIVGALICVGALGYLVWRNAASWASLGQSFDSRYLAVAFVLYTGALLAAALTWHRIVATTAAERDLGRNLRIYVVSALARRLPGSLWGPALRIYWYRRLGGDWRTIGLASVFEAWALTISGAAIAVAGALLFIGPAASLRTWLVLVVILVALGVLFTPRARAMLFAALARLLRTAPDANAPALGSKDLASWVGLEILNWIAGGLMLAAILRALTPYPLAQFPSIIACWAAAGTVGALLTFVPGGFGIVELALAGLLGFIVPAPVALAAAIGLRFFVTACEVVWMLIGWSAPGLVAPVRARKWWS